jgi:hypothetical protein
MNANDAVAGAVQAGRMAIIIEHVKNNNIAYLIGVLISYQMGILDKVVSHGQGICA